MNDLRDVYQEVILDHYRKPRNFHPLEEANQEARGHNPLCGDRVSVFLEIEGDSMIDAGIHDGDTVIIRQDNTARGGEIVVALVDDEEATLKTFRKEGSEIALEAANPAYETRRFSSDRVKVQGKLVGLLRQYH